MLDTLYSGLDTPYSVLSTLRKASEEERGWQDAGGAEERASQVSKRTGVRHAKITGLRHTRTVAGHIKVPGAEEHFSKVCLSLARVRVQGYLTYKKTHPPRPLP